MALLARAAWQSASLFVSALAVVLLAAPDAGTSWTWSYDEVLSAKVDKGAPNVDVSPSPSLRKATLLVTVTEAQKTAPKRLTVQVLSGSDSLQGRAWAVDSNSGEPVLSEVGAKKKKGPPTNVREAYAQAQGTSHDDVRVFTRVVGTLLTPDPIVEAARGGAPCDEAVRSAVGRATVALMKKLATARAEDFTVEDVSVLCEPKKLGSWSVQFAFKQLIEDQPVIARYRGTVFVPAGAWRANLSLQGTSTISLGQGRTALRARTEQRITSSMKPR
ncbi:MAG: hypothetical protein SFW67_16295 [Myxococcaceae bacterium]|nr:hypothetical protein [Myxococcaceae bacterium]